MLFAPAFISCPIPTHLPDSYSIFSVFVTVDLVLPTCTSRCWFPLFLFWRAYLLYSSNLTLFPLTYLVVAFLGEYSGRFRSMKSKFGHLIFYRSHLQ